MTATGKPAQIMAALFDHAALLETTGPRLPVSFPEAKPAFVPPADNKYLVVSFFPNKHQWEGMSDGIVRQGLLQIKVVWPSRQGLIAPTNVADQVITHFAKSTFLTGVRVTKEPWTSPPLTEDSQVSIPVTIPWAS